ncbi:MAG TPA: hypothetical protein VFQ51_06120, partial [Vicinamibacteria bacterium]|nr:hypothetical protein [Vicinamibacteria bacterium]
ARARMRAAADAVPAGNAPRLARMAAAVAAPTESDAPIFDLTADCLAEGSGGGAGADTAPGRRRPARAPKGKAAARGAKVAYAGDVDEALRFLKDVRRTFARRK